MEKCESNGMPDGMKIKNKVIPLPVLHENEQKYSDVVNILDSYQDLVEITYQSCNLPVQQVHIGGDQLTRERFSGAKTLRAAALTDTERLGSLFPITFEIFHLQMAVLSAFYQILYNTNDTEEFTLHAQKIRLFRQDAEGNDVKNHYDSCRDLAVSVIHAYLVEAACEHFNLLDMDESLESLPNFDNMSEEYRRKWLIDKVKPLVQKLLKGSKDYILHGVEHNSSDSVNLYGCVLLELGLIYLYN